MNLGRIYEILDKYKLSTSNPMTIITGLAFETLSFYPVQTIVIYDIGKESYDKIAERLLNFFTPESILWEIDKQGNRIDMTVATFFKRDNLPEIIILDLKEMHRKEESLFSLDAIDEVMDVLLSKNGCPWDLQQTHQTLKTYFIQEVYEVIDAINEENPLHLQEELGDCLYQIIFHAKLAEKEGWFTMQDVIDSISKKMKERHPLLFNFNPDSISFEPGLNWEDQKNKIKKRKYLLEGIPKCLPSLLLACIIHKKVSSTETQNTESGHLTNGRFESSWKSAIGLALTEDGEKTNNNYGKLLFDLVAGVLDEGVDPELALHEFCVSYMRTFTQWEDSIKTNNPTTTFTNSDIRKLWAISQKRTSANNSEESQGGD